MKRFKLFRAAAVLTAVLVLFTSCGFASQRKSSPSPVVKRLVETAAAADNAQTEAPTDGENEQLTAASFGGGSAWQETTSADSIRQETTTVENTDAARQETTTAGGSSSGGSALMSNGTFLVNVNGLKAVSAADTFPVKVESTRTVENAFSGYSYQGNDAIGVTVRNNTDKTITNLRIYLCSYDSSNYYVEIDSGGAVYVQQTIYSIFDWSDLNLAPGESMEIGARLRNAEDIAGVQAIVASYTASDGTKEENKTVSTW